MKIIDILEYYKPTKWKIIATIVLFIVVGFVPIPYHNNLFMLYLIWLMGASHLLVVIFLIPHLLISYAVVCRICFISKKDDYSAWRKAILIAIAVLLPFAVLAISFSKDINDSYYLKAAEAKMDVSKCDKIKGAGRIVRCYERISYLKNSSAFCDSIKNARYRDNCYMQISRIDLKSVNKCEKIVDNFLKARCLHEFARGKNDISICAKIPDFRGPKSYSKEACYIKMAIATKDESICSNIEEVKERSHDEYEKSMTVAEVKKKIMERPLLIGNPYWQSRISCYTRVAEAKKDESVCENIKNNCDKANCIFKVARDKKDKSVCDKIQKYDSRCAMSKEKCYERYVEIPSWQESQKDWGKGGGSN